MLRDIERCICLGCDLADEFVIPVLRQPDRPGQFEHAADRFNRGQNAIVGCLKLGSVITEWRWRKPTMALYFPLLQKFREVSLGTDPTGSVP